MRKYINQIIIVVAFILLLISYKLGVFGYVLAFYLGIGLTVLVAWIGNYLDGKKLREDVENQLLEIYKKENNYPIMRDELMALTKEYEGMNDMERNSYDGMHVERRIKRINESLLRLNSNG